MVRILKYFYQLLALNLMEKNLFQVITFNVFNFRLINRPKWIIIDLVKKKYFEVNLSWRKCFYYRSKLEKSLNECRTWILWTINDASQKKMKPRYMHWRKLHFMHKYKNQKNILHCQLEFHVFSLVFFSYVKFVNSKD